MGGETRNAPEARAAMHPMERKSCGGLLRSQRIRGDRACHQGLETEKTTKKMARPTKDAIKMAYAEKSVPWPPEQNDVTKLTTMPPVRTTLEPRARGYAAWSYQRKNPMRTGDAR
jgi:hypothetical protein